MRPDDNPAALDFDGEEGDLPELDASAADTTDRAAETELEPETDVVADVDEDLLDLDADLGELDAPILDDDLDDLDEALLDPDDDDEDDLEILMLQELGIDLDAPDLEETIDIELGFADDDSADDEVAA